MNQSYTGMYFFASPGQIWDTKFPVTMVPHAWMNDKAVLGLDTELRINHGESRWTTSNIQIVL